MLVPLFCTIKLECDYQKQKSELNSEKILISSNLAGQMG